MLSNWKWYRRLRGGRWAQVSGIMWGKRWIRVTDACVEAVQEDYRPRVVNMAQCGNCWDNFPRSSHCPSCGCSDLLLPYQALSRNGKPSAH